MHVALYARLSDPNERGGSVPAQLRRCGAYAEELGAEYTPFKDDGKSGWDLNVRRTGFDAMIAAIEAGEVQAVVVDRQNRLMRSDETRVWVQRLFEKRAPIVYFADAQRAIDLRTDAGWKEFATQGIDDEGYSRRISRDVKNALSDLRARGFWTSGPTPYGFDGQRVPDDEEPGAVHVKLVVNEREAAALRKAYEGVLHGQSLRSVARQMPGTTRRGNAWNGNTLKQTLLAERNADAIVARGVWQDVGAILTSPDRQPKQRGTKYPLTGIARCGVDDHALVGRPIRGKRRYVCTATGKLHLGVDAEPLETHVRSVVQTYVEQEDVKQEGVGDPRAIPAELLAAISEAESDALEWSRREALDLRFKERSAAQWRAGRVALQERLDELRAEVRAHTATDRTWLRAWIAAGFPEPTAEEERAVFEETLTAIVVAPAPVRGRHEFDASRVTLAFR